MSSTGTGGNTDAPPVLEVRGVSAGYDGLTVLRDVSLAVRPGELVALVGPNGAGKSTLLKVVSGVLRPSSGQVLIDGQDMTRMAPFRRRRAGVCHIPEGRAVYKGLTVQENLQMQAPRGQHRQLMADAMDAFPKLADRRKQIAGTMSGGEQQMLAMSNALVSGNRVILVDEPSLGLAPIIVESIFEFLENDLAANHNVAMIIVDQFVHRLLEIADLAHVMRRGRLSWSGSAAELSDGNVFEKYADDPTSAEGPETDGVAAG